jgi:hypothetical protein
VDTDRPRPELPDPQQDRHVAFPETGSAVSGLPPDAWADHGRTAAATRPPAPARPQSQLRRRPAWLPYAAALGVFLVIGNTAGSHSDPTVDAGGRFSEQWDGPSGAWNQAPDPAEVGWITTVEDPRMNRTPVSMDSAVSPVPPDMNVLRVEVVSNSPQPVSLTLSTSSGLVGDDPATTTPVVKEIHLGHDSSTVNVSASKATETGEVLQCRIYAGTELVAIHTTDTGPVTCDLAW